MTRSIIPALCGLALSVVASAAGAATVTLDAVGRQGSIDQVNDGSFLNPVYVHALELFQTGGFGSNREHHMKAGFASFDTRSFAGQVTDASLRFTVLYAMHSVGQFFDVSTDHQALIAGSVNLASAWDDLRSGTSYGSVQVKSASYISTEYIVPLNAAAVAAINAGGFFTLGAGATGIFTASFGPYLDLVVPSVPEPSTYATLLAGLALLAASKGRQRRTVR